jgi:hypothetical protein
MGVAVGDFNRDGLLDIVKTNFAGDTDSLYLNLGDGTFEDHTYLSGLGINTRYLGWGVGFVDLDNDGWLDIFISNGHVYPEVDGSHLDAPYAEHKYVYRNLRNGQFEEVTNQAGSGITDAVPARGCAFGDYNNDGNMDALVLNMNDLPSLLRNEGGNKQNWIKLRLVGKASNRTGIGARITVTAATAPQAESGICKQPMQQIDELRSGGSYYSQNDLRLHFGLDRATQADLVEIAWPSGAKDTLHNLAANHLYVVEEGGKILKTMVMGTALLKPAVK